MLRSKDWLSCLVGCLVLAISVRSQNVSPPAKAAQATALSTVLSPSFIGMGFEPSNLAAYTGTKDKPNALTMQLLQNLANYTGKPPHLRVGGNTGDTAFYNSSYGGSYFVDNPAATGSTDALMFGPAYFQQINSFPKDTPITFSIPMAYNGSDALDQSVSIAEAAAQAFTNVKLYNFEVGNEPDLYPTNGFRPSGWSAADAGTEWITRVKAIYEKVLKPRNISQAFFEAACTATTAAFPDYKIQNLVKTGIATDNGVWLSGWNQHNYYYYEGVSSYALTLSRFLDLSATSNQFTEWKNQVGQAQVTGKPYYLREMGSVGPAGIEGITDTFAGALWTLNFFLYAASVGVDSIQLHALQNSYSSPWQPIAMEDGRAPFVRPAYYAYAAMSQLNGAGCATQVAQVTVDSMPSGYSNSLGAYAAYNDGDLQSVVLINSKLAYSNASQPIESQSFTLKVPSLAGKTFFLSSLTAAGAEVISNVTWNGMSFEQSGDGTSVMVDRQHQQVQVASDGSFTITVRDSSAVIANLGEVLGSTNNIVDTKMCNKVYTNPAKGDPTGFKSTSGFLGLDKLPLAAKIGIGAGAGVVLVAVVALCIWGCMCCARRRRNAKASRATRPLDKIPLAKPHRYDTVADGWDEKQERFIYAGAKAMSRDSVNSVSQFVPPRRSFNDSNVSLLNSPLHSASPVMQDEATFSNERAMHPPAFDYDPSPCVSYGMAPYARNVPSEQYDGQSRDGWTRQPQRQWQQPISPARNSGSTGSRHWSSRGDTAARELRNVPVHPSPLQVQSRVGDQHRRRNSADIPGRRSSTEGRQSSRMAASSQGHGYDTSRQYVTQAAPPVPPLPQALRTGTPPTDFRPAPPRTPPRRRNQAEYLTPSPARETRPHYGQIEVPQALQSFGNPYAVPASLHLMPPSREYQADSSIRSVPTYAYPDPNSAIESSQSQRFSVTDGRRDLDVFNVMARPHDPNADVPSGYRGAF